MNYDPESGMVRLAITECAVLTMMAGCGPSEAQIHLRPDYMHTYMVKDKSAE